MKRCFLLFSVLLMAGMTYAQTLTFNMHQADNTKYRIEIDVQNKYITATKGGRTVFSCNYYNHKIDNSQKRIGLSLQSGVNAVTSPGGSSYFIISRGKGIATRLTNGTELSVMCDNSFSQAATYDQLARALDNNASNPPANPSTNGSNKTFTVNGVSFTMVYVHGGTFTMGATSEQGSDAYDWEKPTHSVTLSSYMIGQTEVTQALWQAVMGNNPSKFKDDSRCPVEKVSWDDCQTFLRKLNSLTGQKFRLPTEAEWEFAARGGVNRRGYKYSGSNTLDNVAWYVSNACFVVGRNRPNYGTHPVGTKQSNELGIYDMSGNVNEWCNDWSWDYSSSYQTNPQGPSSGSLRVIRGGGWLSDAGGCRVSYRGSYAPGGSDYNLGLRLAL